MPRTALYIDDDPQLPQRANELLARAGFELCLTSDPEEAVRSVRQSAPAIVLMEALLSRCDGFELIRRMKSASGERHLPVVIITRDERTPEIYGQALELEVEDFLCKPVTETQILEAVLEFASNDEEAASPDAGGARRIDFFEGRLAEQPLLGLQARIHRAGASGALKLRNGADVGAVQFRNGSPVEIGRNQGVEAYARFLLRTGRIDQTQYELLVDQLMARVAGPREVLIGMNALTEDQLLAANRDLALYRFLEMFTWTSGQFSFHPDERIEISDTLELVGDPTEIFLKGLKRTPDVVVSAALDRRAHLYVRFEENEASRLDELRVRPEQRPRVASLTGDRTIAEVLGSKVVNARLLYALYSMGVVSLDEIPLLQLDQELKQEDLVSPESSVSQQPSDRTLSRMRPASALGRDSMAPDTVAMSIDRIADRLDSETELELFEIEEASSDADVNAAYRELLAPLLLGESRAAESGDLSARAGDLRMRLEQAYQRVRTADIRRAFAGIRKKAPQKAQERESGERAVDAESWFRTGEEFLAHRDFAQAIDAFGMALHLDPEQGDYAACLGYALYRSNPDDPVIRREATEHVAKGVKLSPGREKPLLYLTRIFRESGDIGSAAKVVRRGLRTNPDSAELVQERCLIESADRPAKRKGRFWQRKGQ